MGTALWGFQHKCFSSHMSQCSCSRGHGGTMMDSKGFILSGAAMLPSAGKHSAFILGNLHLLCTEHPLGKAYGAVEALCSNFILNQAFVLSLITWTGSFLKWGAFQTPSKGAVRLLVLPPPLILFKSRPKRVLI